MKNFFMTLMVFLFVRSETHIYFFLSFCSLVSFYIAQKSDTLFFFVVFRPDHLYIYIHIFFGGFDAVWQLSVDGASSAVHPAGRRLLLMEVTHIVEKRYPG